MLFTHHGLGTAFTSYADYFKDDVDEDALTGYAENHGKEHGSGVFFLVLGFYRGYDR